MSQSSDLVAALERATDRAVATKAPLRVRLKIIADEVRRLNDVLADAVDRFVARLQDAEAGAAAPKVGDPFPDFLLPDQGGRLVGFDTLRGDGPLVIAFLRGHWCPYCKTTAVALGEIADAATAKGARIVAITPESRKYSERLSTDADHKFPVLTDVDNGFALALNLAIWVDDDMARLIAVAGWDVPAYQTAKSWVLPIPATFIVDRLGRVAARYVNADYRTRMDVDDILAALDALAQATAE
ncbi:MAG: peroxiredoxin-like family protein [Parvularculaceae bacterium]